MHKAVTNRDMSRSQFLTTGQIDSLILLVTAPFLLFASRFNVALVAGALALLIVPFAWRLIQTGRLTRYTPANPLIALLLVLFVPVSLIVSPLFWEVSWPRFTTLVWSVGLFFLVVNWPPAERGRSSRTRLYMPVLAYLFLGLAVAVVGLLGMQSVEKLFSVPSPAFAAQLFGGQGLPTNEVAGVLTLFVPFTAALCLGGLLTRRTKLFVALLPLTLLLLVTLVLSQSRTGLVSTAVGLALAFLLVTRLRRTWILAGLVVAGVGLVAAYLGGFADRFIFAGANSWASVVGPRLDVWTQGWNALLDFPITGLGLGTFGLVAPWLYPLVPLDQALWLEDAHNLYLQSTLDLGLLGGVVVAALLLLAVAVLVRRVSYRPAPSLTRTLAAGLLASLIAHMLYSLTDAVALGTLAGVPLWFALALTFAKSSDRPPGKKALVPALLALIAGFAVTAALVYFAGPTNLAATVTARTLLQPEDALSVSTPATASTTCAPHWFAGLQHHAAGDVEARHESWATLLACSDRFIPFMAILAADDVTLAREAVARQPASASGYFWLADQLATTDRDQAATVYLEGLSLAPGDGLRWLSLADLLAERDPSAAQEAYLMACMNGDPGANGCWRAGRIAEQMDNPELAIEYYRLSNYAGARERADELEQTLFGDTSTP